jgi:hypothetical protein
LTPEQSGVIVVSDARTSPKEDNVRKIKPRAVESRTKSWTAAMLDKHVPGAQAHVRNEEDEES